MLMVNNDEYCPVSLAVEITVSNLSPNDSVLKFYVPPRTKNYELISFRPVDYSSKAKLDYKAKWYLGKSELIGGGFGFSYILPYKMGKKFPVIQVENGTFSHEGINAIDIAMPEGTIICAARSGVVVDIVESNFETCLEEKCKELGNYVTIYHEEDGLFTQYVHLKNNGVIVDLGENVKAGQEIGLSGNTGYSAEPHLHFEVFQQNWGKRITYRVGFRTNSENNSWEYLVQNQSYLRKN